MRKKTYPYNIKNMAKLLMYLSILIILQACGGKQSESSSVSSGGGSGSATLTWTAPTTNVDGSPLTSLAGYKVYYGTASGNYTTSVDAGNVTTYTVTGLNSGIKYWFAVTTYDTSANESDYSNEVSKTIQ